MKSNLLSLNESEQRLELFVQAPLLKWESAEYRFLPKRRTIVELFCKTKQPLIGSTIELEPIEVQLLYGELFIIRCSGIDVGYCIKLQASLAIKILGESLMINQKTAYSDGKQIGIDLSLPDIQVIRRDDITQFVIIKNTGLVPLDN